MSWKDTKAIQVIAYSKRMRLLEDLKIEPGCLLIEDLVAKNHITLPESDMIFTGRIRHARVKELIDILTRRMTTRLFFDFVDDIAKYDNNPEMKNELLDAYIREGGTVPTNDPGNENFHTISQEEASLPPDGNGDEARADGYPPCGESVQAEDEYRSTYSPSKR